MDADGGTPGVHAVKKAKDKSAQDAELRRQAKQRLRAQKAEEAGPGTEQDTQRLLHELQVHQVELEMQNEELNAARALAEAVLQRYTDLYDFAPVGLFTLTREGRIVEVNLTGAALLGTVRSKLLRRGLGRFVAREELGRWDQHLASVARSAERQSCELPFRREDGSAFHAHLDSIRLDRPAAEDQAGGSHPALRVAMGDITERKQIEDTHLFLSQWGSQPAGETFFKALARHLSQSLAVDVVCIDRLVGSGLAAETLALYDNGAFRDNVVHTLKDTACGEIVGKTFGCFPAGVRRLFPKDEVLQQMKAESCVGATLWSFDGKPIGLIAVIGRTPLANPALAELVLKVVSFRAAGELQRAQAEESLRQMSEELERSNRDLERFATVAAHDLQEPLRAVAGFSQLLQERYRGRLDERAEKFLQGAVDGAARMQRLVEDLLTFSRVAVLGASLEFVEVKTVVVEALANLTAAIAESGAIVACGPLPRVRADARLLAQLFQNLVGNALKFHGEDVPRIDIGAVRQGGRWLFSVRDNGIGIASRYRESVFEIFRRLHSRAKYAGSGIGLAICKRIVERHGGTIWVESEPGCGATFFFTLPDHEEDEPHP